MTETISPAGSFQGWQFYVWLKRNKENIKLLAAALGGALMYTLSPYPFFTTATVSAITGATGKLVLDAVDFYFTDVKLS